MKVRLCTYVFKSIINRLRVALIPPLLFVSQLSKEVAGLNMNFPLQVNADMPLSHTRRIVINTASMSAPLYYNYNFTTALKTFYRQ